MFLLKVLYNTKRLMKPYKAKTVAHCNDLASK